MKLDSRRFAVLWRRAGCEGPSEMVFAALEAAYAQPHRHYHTARHVVQVLSELDAAEHACEDPVAAELALWFHDGIYDPRTRNNEEMSAQWLETALRAAGGRSATWTRAAAHIRATAHAEAGTLDPDTKAVLDCDLAVLAAPERIFDRYCRDVREEYGWVPWGEYRDERARILRGLLARPRIFQTAAFADYEVPARDNVGREMARLDAEVTV
ncbi:MAG TPA: hypothetical protein VMZ50_01425 [Phycisphaerae bacterium]|nr:hypothetical protein [Phycisphaerae bacterium]